MGALNREEALRPSRHSFTLVINLSLWVSAGTDRWAQAGQGKKCHHRWVHPPLPVGRPASGSAGSVIDLHRPIDLGQRNRKEERVRKDGSLGKGSEVGRDR